MKIKPLFDRVLLRNVEQRSSEGGIYVPKDVMERSLTMQVIAVGDALCVEVGEVVIVGKYTGTDVVVGNDKFWIVQECDILAKVEGA